MKVRVTGLSRATRLGDTNAMNAHLHNLTESELLFKAPEVLQLQSDKIGPASDVFTLGVTFYALIYG